MFAKGLLQSVAHVPQSCLSRKTGVQGVFRRNFLKAPLSAIRVFVAVAICACVVTATSSAPLPELQPENSFKSFTIERQKASSYLACAKPKINQASGNLGALYGCTGGKAETVKFFVNELANSGGQVKNVKFLWNDYTKNVGEGIHADAPLAKQWAGHLADMYAPSQKAQVVRVFFANKNTVIESSTHVLTYTYSKGPAADERMFVVTKK